MVNPRHKSHPIQHKPIKGALVEIASDEEGFRGSWYLGTVLQSPPKSTSKKRNKALIQYQALLADDGSSLLKEYVDPAFIRPLPPYDKEDFQSCFEVNDVVDAKSRDGWWTGVVRKVLGKSKYRVYFDNPPDVIEFHKKDLRLHWDWINGKWVRPEKQQSTGSIFSSGTTVEVNTEEGNLRDVWFPAIVVKENGDNTFLVKHQSSKTDDEYGTVKVVVDSFHIRPSPPRYTDRNYELLERVDTAYNFGWRTGLITKVLPGRRYKVFFKQGNEDKEVNHSDIRPNVEWIDGEWVSKSKEVLIASDEQELVGNVLPGTHYTEAAGELQSSISRKDSTEDKKSLTKKPALNDENNGLLSSKNSFKLKRSNSKTSHSLPSKNLADGNIVETSLIVTCDRLKDMPHETPCEDDPPMNGVTGSRFKKRTDGDQPRAKIESSLTEITSMAKKQKVGSVDSKTNNIVKRSLRARKSPSTGPQVLTAAKEGSLGTAEEINEGEVKIKEVDTPIISRLTAKSTKTLQDESTFQIRNLLNNVKDSVGNENMEIKEHSVGVSNQKRNRGRRRKSVVTSPKAFVAGKESNGAGGLADKKVVKDCTSNDADLSKHKGVEMAASQDAFGERTTDDPKTKEVHLPSAEISNMAVDDDLPLSTWIGATYFSGVEDSRLPSGKRIDEWNKERGLVDVPVESVDMDARSGSPLDDDWSLPFAKKSRLWRTIESMDVFQIMPQKPHFQPLTENREEFREGSAIGIMVTFAGLFEKISMLCFDDPRSTFDSIFESLNDLEKHGFDVTLLRCRLNKLLSIKEGQEKHLGEIENTVWEIIDKTEEVTKLDEEMKEIEKKIIELKERHTVLKSEKETKSLKHDSLKLHVEVLNGRMQNGPRDFKKLASAPWKSP